jgi:hypothetical protein
MQVYFGNSQRSHIIYSKEVKSFQDFCDKYLRIVQKGPKKGSYVVIGNKFKKLIRADENQLSAHMFALDFDMCLLTFEELKKVLFTLPYNFALFTTHSHMTNHVETLKKWKNFYRAFIPCDLPSKAHLTPTVYEFEQQLQNIDARIKVADESRTWSLPWFLPRRANLADDFHRYAEFHAGYNFIAKTPSTVADQANKKHNTSDSIEKQIRIIADGLPNTGLHKATRNLAYQLIMDGVAPVTVKAILRAIMQNYDSENPRQLENWSKVNSIVDSVVNKYSQNWGDPKPIPDPMDLVIEVEFPLHVVPKSMLIAAEEIANFNIASIHDIMPNMIGATCMAINRKAMVETGSSSLKSFYHLGVINISPSGGFKSTIFNMLLQGNKKAINKMTDEFNIKEIEVLSRERFLKKALKNSEKNMKTDITDTKDIARIVNKNIHLAKELYELEQRRRPAIFADDITPERAVDMAFKAGGCLNYISEEGLSFFKSLSNPYNVTDNNSTDLLVRGLSGSTFSSARKSGPNMVFRPVISTMIFCQPDIYRENFLFKKISKASGLIARMITVDWRRQKYAKNAKTKNNVEVNQDKMAEYWKRTEQLMLFDDRNSHRHYSVDDDFNQHIIKPVTILVVDSKLIHHHIDIFNDIFVLFGKGEKYENQAETLNKCLQIAYIMAGSLYAYHNYKTFFQTPIHILDMRMINIVKELAKYLLEKKSKEHDLHQQSVAIKSARRILKVLTSDANYENTLRGLTEAKFKRIFHMERKTENNSDIHLGLDLLFKLNLLKVDKKERFILNPKVSKNDTKFNT